MCHAGIHEPAGEKPRGIGVEVAGSQGCQRMASLVAQAQDPPRRAADQHPAVLEHPKGVVELDVEARRKRDSQSARPPSTGIAAPVTAAVSARESQAIAAATSSGVISRASGCWLENASDDSRP